jgi:hypothetical protein
MQQEEEDNVERAGPDGEEWEEDKAEVVPHGSQCDGDADRDDDIWSLGAPLRRPSTTAESVVMY